MVATVRGHEADEQLEQAIHLLMEHEAREDAVRLVIDGNGLYIRKQIERHVRDTDQREETFQLFAVNVAKGIGKFKWERPLVNWLCIVARNAGRKTAPRSNVDIRPPDEVAELRDHIVFRPKARATYTLDRPELIAELREICRSLEDPLERRILELHVIEGLSWPKVAARLEAEKVWEGSPEAARKVYERKAKEHVIAVWKQRHESAVRRGR